MNYSVLRRQQLPVQPAQLRLKARQGACLLDAKSTFTPKDAPPAADPRPKVVDPIVPKQRLGFQDAHYDM